MNKLIMSPGPTEVHPDVLQAMATQGTNPDLDPAFYDYYQAVVLDYNRLIGSGQAKSFFMAGEAILGLEAACASLIEPGDQVLCIANGFFGAGFKDFIEMYGGQAIMLNVDWQGGIDLSAVQQALAEHPAIKLATMVHCETPTGITNDIAPICQYLHGKGVLSIVDSVSAVAGEQIAFDQAKIDVLIGGTQKCLSVPTGLTLMSLSPNAVNAIKVRKSAITGYYSNLKHWLDWHEQRRFPYTQAQQLIYALAAAIKRAHAEDSVAKHRLYAQQIRQTLTENGFLLYAKTHHSNTVTAVYMPTGIDYQQLFDTLNQNHNIIIGGSLGDLKGKLFRIGHMGANNDPQKFIKLFDALDQVLRAMGQTECTLSNTYQRIFKQAGV